MAKIEVGMLVEILPAHKYDPGQEEFPGHIGRVLRKSPVYDGHWVVEGAEKNPATGAGMVFREDHLRPINPDSDDIRETREQGAPSFDEMMRRLIIEEQEAVK